MVALFILAAFIFFIALDFAVLKVQGKTHPAFEKVISLSGLSILPEMEIKVPGDILLSKGHIWMKKNKSGLIKLGIDDFINRALGSISIQNNLSIGKELKCGDVMFEGALGNKKIKFRSPVNGIVKAINFNPADAENFDPYSDWNIELSSRDFNESKANYFSGIDALNWLKNEFTKLDNFLMIHSVRLELAGVTMYDGGKVIMDIPAKLIEGSAEDFEKEFLSL